MLRQPLLTLLLASAWAWGQSATQSDSAPTQPAQQPSAAADETHQPRIHGLEIGMTVRQVLDVLARMPDKRDDKDGDVVVYWKLEDESVLQANFHKEHVSHLGLQYRPPRPTNDFWLVPLEESSHYKVTDPNRKHAVEAEGTTTLGDPQNISSAGMRDTAPRISTAENGGSLETPDKRLRRDYRVSETYDKERTVWQRELQAPAGYSIELSFLSVARQEFGDRHETKVEYKYVSVPKDELKHFEGLYADTPGPPAALPTTPPGKTAAGPLAAADETHLPKIDGLEIGMTAADVLHRLGRKADKADDKNGELILYWKLEDNNVLEVNFRGEHISHLALQYRPPRPVGEFWLVPVSATVNINDPEGSTYATIVDNALKSGDPRVRRDYKTTETSDKERAVWTRTEKAPAGYQVEVAFLSAARQRLGLRFRDQVEYKDVSVPREDMKKFDQAYAGK